MKQIIGVLSFFMLCQESRAQPLHLGLEAGPSYSKTSAYDVRWGWRYGIAAKINFSKHIDFQFGLNRSAKGSTDPNSRYKTSYNSLELPLGLNYSTDREKFLSFYAGAGVYLSWTYQGRLHLWFGSVDTTVPVRYGAYLGNSDLRRFEYGMQVYTGLALKNGFFLRAQIQHQLNDLAPSKLPTQMDPNPPLYVLYPRNSSLKNDVLITASVGYYLPLKRGNEERKAESK